MKPIFRARIRYWLRGRLAELRIRPGDIYEDCQYHPVLCLENVAGDLAGISLIDGSGPRCCSQFHCGVRKLTLREAEEIKKNWSDRYVQLMDEYWSGKEAT